MIKNINYMELLINTYK